MIAIYIIGVLIVIGTILAFVIPEEDESSEVTPYEIALVLDLVLRTFAHNLSEHEKECIKVAIKKFEEDEKGHEVKKKPHTLEEMILVLNAFRTDGTEFEKCVLDEISDDLIELDRKKVCGTPVL